MAKLDELVVELKADVSGLKRDLKRATASIRKTEKVTEKSTQKMAASFKKLAISTALAYASIETLKKSISVITAFEKLEASLKTVTGSAEAASEAFSQITDFAATTPFQLEEVVASFIKLKALVLDPSEEAMRSYGNTASAMGKSMNQMVEAIADAATGEFERLKEFGIKARSQGEDVTFTFQGVSTKVGKNAKEIEGFLRSIGNVQFAGAMKEQFDTLNVSISNMNDSWAKLIKAIGDAGVTSVLKGAADALGLIADGWKMLIEFDVQEGSIADRLGFENAREKAAEELRAIDVLVQESIIKQAQMLAEGKETGNRFVPDLAAEFEKSEELSPKQLEAQTDLETLKESLMSEIELIKINAEEKLAVLAEAREARILMDNEYNELEKQIESEKQDAFAELHKKRMEKEKSERDKAIAEEIKAQNEIKKVKDSAASNAMSLLNKFSSRNKAAAIAAIAISKATAIAQTLAHAQTAAMLAYASQLVPGDPTSIIRAQAAKSATLAMGSISAGLIAAGGVVEAAGVMSSGDESTGYSGTTPVTNVDSVTGLPVTSTRRDVTIVIEGEQAELSKDLIRAITTGINDFTQEDGGILIATEINGERVA